MHLSFQPVTWALVLNKMEIGSTQRLSYYNNILIMFYWGKREYIEKKIYKYIDEVVGDR